GTDQLIALNRILAFKDAGFTLEEIRHFMRERLSRDELLHLLNSKLSLAEQELTFTQMKVSNLRARIKHIKNEEDYEMVDVTVKRIEPVLVASIRKQYLTPSKWHGSVFGVVIDDVAAHGIKEVGPILMVRHDGRFERKNGETKWEVETCDWEACVQIEKEYSPSHPDILVHYLPAVDKMACAIHKGDWGDATQSATAELLEWLKLNGLEWIHPSREIYHNGERENPDWVCYSLRRSGECYEAADAVGATFVTEIQYPLR
ncbi:MAG: hypothetical protein AAGU32_19645, partial [Bacillota bacterium]